MHVGPFLGAAGTVHFNVASSSVHDCCVSYHGQPRLLHTPTVWDHGGIIKRRKMEVRVDVDVATMPAPFLLWDSTTWTARRCVPITSDDVGLLPCSVSLLCEIFTPHCTDQLVTRILRNLNSYLELLTLFGQWAGIGYSAKNHQATSQTRLTHFVCFASCGKRNGAMPRMSVVWQCGAITRQVPW